MTQVQQDPRYLLDKLVAYVLQVRRLFRMNSYQPCKVISMDEAAVWAKMLSDTIVDRTGVRTVSLKTTGHEIMRVLSVWQLKLMVPKSNQ